MVTDADVHQALSRERLRLHAKALPVTLLTSAAVGGLLAYALAPSRPLPVAAWCMALLVALCGRTLVTLAQQRDARGSADTWLARHRWAYAGHGLVWGALALYVAFGGLGGPGSLAGGTPLAVFALAAITAGAFVHATFDLRASLLFAAPPLLGMAVGAARGAGGTATAMWLLALVIVAVGVVGARRGQRTMGEAIRLRLAAQLRADEAREQAERADGAYRQLADQHQLLKDLLQTTRQGFWFIDTEARTTDLNPGMARILGRPREAVMGRRPHEFAEPSLLPLLEQELAQRATGALGSYEMTLLRPDGTPVYCLCQASPLHDAAGRRIGSVGVWADISERRQAEATLRGYALAVNSITEMVSVVDTEERYLLVNEAWTRWTGVPRERALGAAATVAVPSVVASERQRAVRECIATAQVQVARVREQREGSERLLETTYYPQAGADGRVMTIAMITRDVTEAEQQRDALLAREAELRALLAAFPGFITAMDGQGVYTYVSDRSAQLFGRPAVELVGQNIEALHETDRATEVREELRRAAAGEVPVAQRRYALADGRQLDLEIIRVAGPPQADGRRTFYAFGVDMTAHRLAQEALTGARDEAERANRAKSEFLSHMSHELRTPMNAILGFGQLLQADTQPPLAAHQQAWAREILRGAGHLLELINEILDLGRIEAGELAVESVAVELAPLLAEAQALVQGLAASRGVRLLPLPAGVAGRLVQADRRRLKQVLLNLLANAVKYNRAGGDVELGVQEADDGWLLVTVQDHGPGLGPDEQARLFQPFERLAAARSGVEGTGIGLALSRRLMQAMGGHIGVDSEPGRGSRFWLRLPPGHGPLPLPAGDEASPPALPPPRSADGRHTVLYIEDNEVNVVLMQAMLERLPGVHLRSALHPHEGLRLALEAPPSLVLLDMQLPDLDGFGVLARLREHAATQGVPVVAVSANALQRDIEAALAAGFDEYLTKPVRLEDLLACVQRQLARPR